MGFAAIGLYLLYLANRYNLLFVLNPNIDTKGLVYPRALQQTTVGAYITIVYLIVLFAIKTAIGPLILMVAFLVLVALVHISFTSAVSPLLEYLPKSLEAEEQSLLAVENGQQGSDDATATKDGNHLGSKFDTPPSTKDGLPPAPHKQPNFFVKWLKPNVYTDYQTLRRLVPHGFADISYDATVERDAYYHPAISSPPPLLWIPRDRMGISRQECQHSSKVIPMTDEDAEFDEKNKIVWNQEHARPPIYEEKVYY